MYRFPPTRILVPTDFSEYSEQAIKYAAEMAARNDGSLTLLHVAPDIPAIVSPIPESTAMQAWSFTEALRERCVAAHSRMEESVGPIVGDVEFTVRFEEGEAASTIARVAREIDADLVVMGSHGRTGLRRALLGSVAERTVRLAETPVLIVR